MYVIEFECVINGYYEKFDPTIDSSTHKVKRRPKTCSNQTKAAAYGVRYPYTYGFTLQYSIR